jgi:hypothetical protein
VAVAATHHAGGALPPTPCQRRPPRSTTWGSTHRWPRLDLRHHWGLLDDLLQQEAAAHNPSLLLLQLQLLQQAELLPST